jgi:beta-mannanase
METSKIEIPSINNVESARFVGITSRGGIPNVLADTKGVDFDPILKGNYDHHLRAFADGATEYGKQYGGFFFTTMREINGNWFAWGGNPSKAKQVWRHIWRIFEESGANEYTTWIWEIFCPEAAGNNIDSPERYYPGDEYVDWIGLSAYSRSMYPTVANASLRDLTTSTYHDMHSRHPHKPIMMAEFGKSTDSGQPRWLRNAFKTIKSWSGMKAAIYWDSTDYQLHDDL